MWTVPLARMAAIGRRHVITAAVSCVIGQHAFQGITPRIEAAELGLRGIQTMAAKLVAVVFALLLSACSLQDTSSGSAQEYRVRGERAARVACSGSGSRRNADLAR